MPLPAPGDSAWRITIGVGSTTELYGDNPTLTLIHIRVRNPNLDKSIWVGGVDVTSANGYELGPGEAETFTIRPYLSEQLCAVIKGAPAVQVECRMSGQ